MDLFMEILPYMLCVLSFIAGGLATWLVKEYYDKVDEFWREYDD